MRTCIAITIIILTITFGHAETKTTSTKSIPVKVPKEKTNVHSKKILTLQQEKDSFTTTLSNLQKIKRQLKTKSGNRVDLDSSKIDSYIKSLQDFNKDRNNMPDYLRREVMAESQDIVDKLQHYIYSEPTRGRTTKGLFQDLYKSKEISKLLDFRTGKNNKAVSTQNDETTIEILNNFKNDITVSYIPSGRMPPDRPALHTDGRKNFGIKIKKKTKKEYSCQKMRSIFDWTIWARRGNIPISEYTEIDHEQLKAKKIKQIRLKLLKRINHEK